MALKYRLFALFLSVVSYGTIQGESPHAGANTVFVPYANHEKNKDLEHSPTIRIGFNGSHHHEHFTMDTGSVGIIASSDIFQPAPGAKNLGPGRQIYSSSGIIEEGTWWTATQDIYDADGTLLATANVPVLQVTKVSCTDNARSCSEFKHPKQIAMLGMGFARESQTQTHGTPAYNPLLNLQTVRQNGVMVHVPQNWINGYVVTPAGVYLGLNAKNTENAGWVKLAPWPEHSTPSLPEWKPAPMTIVVNGASGNGNILMDTGVGTAYLKPPSGANLGHLVKCPGSSLTECAPDGTKIEVYLPNQSNPVAFYSFTVGEANNLMQPKNVHVTKSGEPFLNSSRHVLAGFNYIYDSTNGYVGYAWNGHSKNTGHVIPSKIVTSINK